MNKKHTSNSVLTPYGSMSNSLVAIPAGWPAAPRCRPTVFYTVDDAWLQDLCRFSPFSSTLQAARSAGLPDPHTLINHWRLSPEPPELAGFYVDSVWDLTAAYTLPQPPIQLGPNQPRCRRATSSARAQRGWVHVGTPKSRRRLWLLRSVLYSSNW